MPDRKPFIYIASLRRTGSTVLAEALTLLPHSFIFREPRLADNYFKLKPSDAALFKEHGLDIAAWLASNRLGHLSVLRRTLQRGHVLRQFADELLPRLAGIAAQVGVKEIRNEGWRRYQALFPDMKIIQTARDPRDIYISVYHRKKKGQEAGFDLDPKSMARQLNKQFGLQQEMSAANECLQVSYEDLCTQPGVFDRIKAFTDSPIPSIGAVGAFNAANPKRTGEAAMHGSAITSKRVARWREEPDPVVRRQALELFRRMPAYCAYWNYRE